MIKMKWIIILLLLFSSCKKGNDVITDYAPLTDEEVKCIIKNATPVNKVTDTIINKKYYEWADPKFQECFKRYIGIIVKN